jgi:hypothetical protein
LVDILISREAERWGVSAYGQLVSYKLYSLKIDKSPKYMPICLILAESPSYPGLATKLHIAGRLQLTKVVGTNYANHPHSWPVVQIYLL